MDNTTILCAARSGISDLSERLADLVGSLPDATAPILPGTWTVRDAVVHIKVLADLCTELAEGAPCPPYTGVDAFNAEGDALIADIPETDPRKLAALMTDAAGRLLDACPERSAGAAVDFYALAGYDVARLACVEVGEFAVHGYDIATAVGRPWPIDPLHAQLSLYGIAPAFAMCLNPETAPGHTAAYGIELRGGEGLVMRFTDGQFSLEAPGSGPVDCVISADPVAFLLVGFGRMTQWEAIALGLLSAGGDRPELALGFLNLFAIP